MVCLDDRTMENTDLYPDDMSTTTALPTTTIHTDIVPNSTVTAIAADTDNIIIQCATSVFSPASANTSSIITGGVIGGIISILLLVGIVLLVAVLIQWRHKKHYTIESNNLTYPNPVYDGGLQSWFIY